MKKSFLFLLIIILSFNFTKAVIFDLQDDSLEKGQTLLGKIQGNFINGISNTNILFYKGDMRIPFNFVLKNIQGDYYLYADSEGRSPGNYSIKIKDVSYLQNGQLSNQEIIKNFSIEDKFVEFSVSPGIIETNKNDNNFYIEIKNKEEKDLEVNIKIISEEKGIRELFIEDRGSLEEETDLKLKIGETKSLKFVLGDLGKSGIYKIIFKSDSMEYEITVYVSSKDIIESNRIGWEYYTLTLDNLKINQKNTKILRIINLKKEDLEEVSFQVSESLKDYIKVLNDSTTLKSGPNDIYLEIESSESGEVQGLISANKGQEITTMSLKLIFINENQKSKETKNNTDSTEAKFSCNVLGGSLCDSGKICNGGTIMSSTDDNEMQFCCVNGQCIESSNKSAVNSNSKIGIILIVIILLALIIIFAKFKSAKKPIELIKKK
jgi:hypothetical protein